MCQYDFTDVEYGALNTGAWWHVEETLVAKRMNLEHLIDDHCIAPVILFDDYTITDAVRRLTTKLLHAHLGILMVHSREMTLHGALLGNSTIS